MSDVQSDLDPSGLIAAIEGNTIESIRSWTKWSKLCLHQDPDVLWTSSKIPYFIFNMVLTVNPTAELLAVIETQLSQAKQRKVPIAWWVGPSNAIPELAKELEDKGLFQVAELTGMAVDLHELDEKASPFDSVAKVEAHGGFRRCCWRIPL